MPRTWWDSLGGTVYDAANRLTSRQMGTGGGVIGPGALDEPLGGPGGPIGVGGAVRIDWTYTVRNEVATVTHFSDLAGTTQVGRTESVYDATGRLTNLQQKTALGTAFSNTTYVYDLADRITSETLNGGTPRTYTYDVTDQLTADATNTFTYDLNGNRTNVGYVTGVANRITSDGTWTYTYDAAGRRTKKSKGASQETWTYQYDHDGHLTLVEKRATDGGTLQLRVTYTVDVWGVPNRIVSAFVAEFRR